MKTILAIESGGIHCSVCLWRRGSGITSIQEGTQGAAGSLLPQIELLLQEAEISFKDLDCIAVSVGPGSYTGLRIGLAVAQGLGFGLSIPVHGVCSFLALATATKTDNNRAILVLLDGKRQDVFARYYTHQAKPLTAPLVIRPEEIPLLIGNKQTMIIGDGIAKLPASVASLANSAYQPHARHVAKLAASQLQQKQPGLDIAPVYLRAPDVSEAKKLFWSLPDDYSAT